MVYLQFLISTTLIVAAGTRLTMYADALSDRLNLGKVWIGAVVLGLVTSLPEAVASLTAVISLQAYDLAVGNILGSNNFNPVMIVAVDIFYRQGAVTDTVRFSRSHALSALFAVILTLFVIAEIVLREYLPAPLIGTVSVVSLDIAIVFFFGMYVLSRVDGPPPGGPGLPGGTVAPKPLPAIYLSLLASAAVVVLAAVWLADSADKIAFASGLGRTFVGSIFLALATSLPEVVVSVTALRLGSLDLAVGNIFGSNMTNIFILFLCDLAGPGAMLAMVSSSHLIMAVTSIVMTGIVLLGFRIRGKKTFLRLGWDSWILIALFLTGTGILYSCK